MAENVYSKNASSEQVQCSKIYVAVTARFDLEGTITPLAIEWENGKIFEIDKVIDVRRAASLKAGGQGMRYTVRIGTKEAYLFLEKTRWFVEGKV